MTLPPLAILPLPSALGMDNGSVIQQPRHLRIQPSGIGGHGLTTDIYGREIVSAHYIKKTQTDFSLPGQPQLIFRLKPLEKGLVRYFSNLHIYILQDAQGKDIATFTPYNTARNSRALKDRIYVIDCLDGISGGHAQLTLRGSLHSSECALMIGAHPVAIVQRASFSSWYGSGYSDTYDAVVAPGVDLIWIATILRCLDILYAVATVDER